jgi:uroporphyrinogen III methyltransferase / synthase
MGVRALPDIVARLVRHGLEPDTPAAVIASATLADARTIVGTLASIAELAREAGIEAPATLVVGNVVRVRERLAGAGEPASAAAAHLAGTGPMRQRTVAVATTSPAASAMTDSKSCSASRDVSGKGQRASAVRRPRAFFR